MNDISNIFNKATGINDNVGNCNYSVSDVIDKIGDVFHKVCDVSDNIVTC